MKPQTYFWGLLSIVIMGCADDFVPTNASEETAMTRVDLQKVQQEDQVFYWYGIENEKIFLNQVKDKV